MLRRPRPAKALPVIQTSLAPWSRRCVVVEATEGTLHHRYQLLVASRLGQGKCLLIIRSRFVDATEFLFHEAAIIVGSGTILT